MHKNFVWRAIVDHGKHPGSEILSLLFRFFILKQGALAEVQFKDKGNYTKATFYTVQIVNAILVLQRRNKRESGIRACQYFFASIFSEIAWPLFLIVIKFYLNRWYLLFGIVAFIWLIKKSQSHHKGIIFFQWFIDTFIDSPWESRLCVLSEQVC